MYSLLTISHQVRRMLISQLTPSTHVINTWHGWAQETMQVYAELWLENRNGFTREGCRWPWDLQGSCPYPFSSEQPRWHHLMFVRNAGAGCPRPSENLYHNHLVIRLHIKSSELYFSESPQCAWENQFQPGRTTSRSQLEFGGRIALVYSRRLRARTSQWSTEPKKLLS